MVARCHGRPPGTPRPPHRGPGRRHREPVALLGTGEQPRRPRRRHPPHPPPHQRHRPAGPGPLLVPDRLAPFRPPPPGRRPRRRTSRRRGHRRDPAREGGVRRPEAGRKRYRPGHRGAHGRRERHVSSDRCAGTADSRPLLLPPDAVDLVARVADSVRRTATFITDRRAQPADGPDLFLAAEQALLLGHPLHPTPKSREGLAEAEARLYSPELRGSFPLHWLAVAPSVLATDSAWTERGRPIRAEQLTAQLIGAALPLPLPDGYAALPLHPGRSARPGTAHRSRPCSRPVCSATSAPMAPPGTPPPPYAPSTARAPPRC